MQATLSHQSQHVGFKGKAMGGGAYRVGGARGRGPGPQIHGTLDLGQKWGLQNSHLGVAVRERLATLRFASSRLHCVLVLRSGR